VLRLATAYNKAYLRRSEYLTWATPHCGKRPPQRQVSKALAEIPPPMYSVRRRPWRLINTFNGKYYGTQ